MPLHTEPPSTVSPLRFVAAVSLRFDTPLSVGETPDGVRLDFRVHGTVTGPELKGKFPPCAAYLLIDPDGVGTINVRAPLLLDDGAVAELESTGRYDFGEDGYKRAVAGDLPDSDLGWCPRFLTGHPRYQWLNRTLFLGVGKLVPKETSVNYDLFAMSAPPDEGPGYQAPYPSTAYPSAMPAPGYGGQKPLYDRLGGREGIRKVVDSFLEGLLASDRLHLQNPKVAAAHRTVNRAELKRKVTEVFIRLTGGPSNYTGRPLRAAHAPLDITDADWAIAGEELVKAMNRHNVPGAEQDELLATIAATKSDIVQQRSYR